MYLPDYFEFLCRGNIVSGMKAVDKLPVCLKELKAKKPMVITDKGVIKAGLLTYIKKALATSIKINLIYDKVPADSDLNIVHDIVDQYNRKKCDSIIALGGGSVMDTAKAVNILVTENDNDLLKYSGYNIISRKLKPLIAIPTTGTGSEVTMVASIEDHNKNIKMLFLSPYLLPDVAILDPRMTKTLPLHLTAATAMDALSHAVEAYTCLQKNPVTDGAAIMAIMLLRENLMKVIKKPNDQKARLAMANSALLAGTALSNSEMGLVHTLSHATGAVCKIPHGVGIAVFLPYGLEYNLHKTEKFVAELLYPLAGEDVFSRVVEKDKALEMIKTVRKLNEELHKATGGKHPRTLKEIKDSKGQAKISKKKFPLIAERCLEDATTVMNPEQIDYDDAIMVLEHAWDGRPLDRTRIKRSAQVFK